MCADVTRAPGGLEVEPARNGINVKDFSRKVEALDFFAFKGADVYVGNGHAAGGYKLVLELSFAGDGIGVLNEGGCEAVESF